MHCTNGYTHEPVEPAVARVASLVSAGVLVVAFGAMAVGIEWFWLAFPLGYGAVLPAAISYTKARTERTSEPATADPLASLKQRYVDGDIDEATFERELEARLGDE